MNNQKPNPKMTNPVLSSSQMSSAPELYSVQAAKINSALSTTLRDQTPPTVARKSGRSNGSRVEENHKSSPLPRSSSRIGGGIAPSAASSAIPFALHVNTCGQAVLLSSGSAPTTIPRFRIISDAREAIEQLIRARSSARISTQESMYDQEPEQSAFPMYDRQPEQSSHQESMYDRQPVQSAFSQRPAPSQRRRLPEGLRRGYQQRSYQHREHPQTQPLVQPSAFQQPRHANEDSKRWHQSLWDDDGMM